MGPLGTRWRRCAEVWSGLTARAGRRMNWEAEPTLLRLLGRELDRTLPGLEVDAVVTMGWYPIREQVGSGAPPIFYWGDAPMAERIGRSPYWSGISRRTQHRAVRTEELALPTLTGVLMSSEWAVGSMVASGVVDPNQIRCVPFGANLEDPGVVDRGAPRASVSLLTVGVDWERKGIDRAIAVTEHLRGNGLECHLDVVGVTPPNSTWQRPWVTFHGFVSKKTVEGSHLLDKLYRTADVFLLPTVYEPFGIVLTEAYAYSLPVVVTDVDGIPERVSDGGRTVGGSRRVEDFADAVLAILSRYSDYSDGARSDFVTRGNWTRSASILLDSIRELA